MHAAGWLLLSPCLCNELLLAATGIGNNVMLAIHARCAALRLGMCGVSCVCAAEVWYVWYV
jgi:hypothetical protein